MHHAPIWSTLSSLLGHLALTPTLTCVGITCQHWPFLLLICSKITQALHHPRSSFLLSFSRFSLRIHFRVHIHVSTYIYICMHIHRPYSLPTILECTIRPFHHGLIWAPYIIPLSATRILFMELKENPSGVTYLLEYCLLCMVSWLQPLTKLVLFGKHSDSILSWDLHYTVQDLEKSIITQLLCSYTATMPYFLSDIWQLTNLYFVRTNIKNFNDTSYEVPDSFKIWPPNTPWAIHQQHDISFCSRSTF